VLSKFLALGPQYLHIYTLQFSYCDCIVGPVRGKRFGWKNSLKVLTLSLSNVHNIPDLELRTSRPQLQKKIGVWETPKKEASISVSIFRLV